ncbi:ThiF family adenylyltransferase [Chitinimonas sp.]|uniref:ThiF family adenylyltransferase n=1 Tax=Chitinimonas sp. TaxID=1934313 RepID=UPI002F9346BF
MSYDYKLAVSRNIGWISEAEQETLRRSRVAIAGLGGVGGAHLLTLARLGIGGFNLAEFDEFEVQNFNRQVGATIPNLGRSKLDSLIQMALDINPELSIRRFDQGVTEQNLDDFLDGTQAYVDGLDFFVLNIRRRVFAACSNKGIAALTAAPLGMGVALLYFKPGGMTFDEYFRLDDQPQFEQYARFIAGLSPAMLQRDYLVVPSAVNFLEKRGPSTMMACDLCAGVMGTEVLKVLLGRGKQRAAPWGMHFDAYHQKMSVTWRPWGNANPLQQLMLMLIRKRLKGG